MWYAMKLRPCHVLLEIPDLLLWCCHWGEVAEIE